MERYINKISAFTQSHFPIWHTHPEYVLIILCLIVCTGWYWFWSRSKASLTILGAELLYLIPFIR
jgi:hypothetical protein